MNVPLERLSERVIPFLAIVAGIGLALYGGKLAAQGQFSTVAFIAIGLITLALVIKLNTRVWMIMFLTWPLIGKMGFLDIPFTMRELFALVPLFSSFVMIAFKMIRGKATFGGLDALLWVNILYLVTVFIRNPVGLDIFDAERVGGRDYFDTGIACAAFFILSRTTATPGQARKLPLFMAFSTGVVAVLSVITYFKPSLFPILGTLYSGIYSGSYQAGDVQAAQWMGETNTDRINTLLYFAQAGFLCLCSFYRPITLINPFYFGRFCMMLVCAAATMFAGFRSILFYNAIIFFLSSYFRGQLRQTASVLLLSIPLIIIILVGQGRMFDLPLPAQRALSFLPGDWKYEVVQDAKGSTDWRVEMWKRALTTDRYIENKLLGDGFGFRQLDMQRLERISAHGESYEATQEKMMLAGNYHSGPVSAIRYAGYVGLLLYYIFIIAMAVYAKRLIRSCWKTPFFIPALFFCIPVFFHPFFFTFIFGGYAPDLVDSIFAFGCLKMIERSLTAYRDNTDDDTRGARTLETAYLPSQSRESHPAHAHSEIFT